MPLLARLQNAHKKGLFDAWHDHVDGEPQKDSVLITCQNPTLLTSIFNACEDKQMTPAQLLADIGYLTHETP